MAVLKIMALCAAVLNNLEKNGRGLSKAPYPTRVEVNIRRFHACGKRIILFAPRL